MSLHVLLTSRPVEPLMRVQGLVCLVAALASKVKLGLDLPAQPSESLSIRQVSLPGLDTDRITYMRDKVRTRIPCDTTKQMLL